MVSLFPVTFSFSGWSASPLYNQSAVGVDSHSCWSSTSHLRNDSQMAFMKTLQFLRSPPPLSIYVQNASTSFTYEFQFQTKSSPPLQMITNQLKENIIQRSLSYVIRIFLTVVFLFHSINLAFL